MRYSFTQVINVASNNNKNPIAKDIRDNLFEYFN